MANHTPRRGNSMAGLQPVTLPDNPAEAPPLPEGVEPQTAAQKWGVWDDTQLEICKRIAGGMPIFMVENGDEPFVVRAMRSGEWNDMLMQFEALGDANNQGTQDELLAKNFTIWPKLPPTFWDTTLAGHPATLSAAIRRHSKFPLILESGNIIADKMKVTDLYPAELLDIPEPTEEQFDQWRASVPGGALFGLNYEGSPYKFIFGQLRREVWKSIQNRMEKGQELDVPMETVKAVTVWGNCRIENTPAGIIDALASQIMKVSGFNLEPIVTEL